MSEKAVKHTYICATDSFWSLYDGFRPLIIRQVIFGMMKFFVFDSFADAVYQAVPELRACSACPACALGRSGSPPKVRAGAEAQLLGA